MNKLIVLLFIVLSCGTEEKKEVVTSTSKPPTTTAPQVPRSEPPEQQPNRGTLTPGPGKNKPKPPGPGQGTEPHKPKPEPEYPPNPKPEPEKPRMPDLGHDKNNYYWRYVYTHWLKWPWCHKLPSELLENQSSNWKFIPNQAEWCQRHTIPLIKDDPRGGCMCKIP